MSHATKCIQEQIFPSFVFGAPCLDLLFTTSRPTTLNSSDRVLQVNRPSSFWTTVEFTQTVGVKKGPRNVVLLHGLAHFSAHRQHLYCTSSSMPSVLEVEDNFTRTGNAPIQGTRCFVTMIFECIFTFQQAFCYIESINHVDCPAISTQFNCTSIKRPTSIKQSLFKVRTSILRLIRSTG